jgi:hypothetical protein
VERLVSEMKRAVAVRDQFISVASYELKTPLAALMAVDRGRLEERRAAAR